MSTFDPGSAATAVVDVSARLDTAGSSSDDTVRSFRRTAGRFATGVAVATSLADDVPIGMTVNAFTTVSLEPMLVLVCLRNTCRLLTAMQGSEVFALTVLAAHQKGNAQWFASGTRPTGVAGFAGISTRPAPSTRCLVLSEGVAFFDCRVRNLHVAGDHAIVIGEVMAFGELSSHNPLVFVDGDYRTDGVQVHSA